MADCIFCNKNRSVSLETQHSVCVDCLNLALQDYFSKMQRQKRNTNTQTSSDLEEYCIGFGKNRGKKILEVEPDYIRWCLENFDGLRDVDIFNQALERLTGDRVETPAAKKTSVPTAIKSVSKEINTAFDEASVSEEGTDFPF
jgi:hypothetical protein